MGEIFRVDYRWVVRDEASRRVQQYRAVGNILDRRSRPWLRVALYCLTEGDAIDKVAFGYRSWVAESSKFGGR